MRMLGPNRNEAVEQLQIYLSAPEARKLIDELRWLLANPEANEHIHVFSEDSGAELSCSIVTQAKLAGTGYTKKERRAFGGWKPSAPTKRRS